MTTKLPLCIDCDNTLIATDLLFEACFLLLKQHPTKLFLLPFWLIKGKAFLKQRLTEYVTFDWETLPYRPETLEVIEKARQDERKVVLATASPKVWAEGIANHLKCFDEIFATEKATNLSSRNKADKLTEQFGIQGFDYVGDSKDDIAVWKNANKGIIVNNQQSLVEKIQRLVGRNLEHVKIASPTLLSYAKALRIYQWLKNALIFVPLLAAHEVSDLHLLTKAIYAFIAFSCCASSVYILNDLLDLESDRRHPRKRRRPFASGAIPILHGAILMPILLVTSVYISLAYLPPLFTLTLALYYLMTIAYSGKLKQQVVVDIILLAALYTIRILAGSAATKIEPSFWLLVFSLFTFLSLALVKRYSEMSLAIEQNKFMASGRGYYTQDLIVIMCLGVSAAMCSVMIFALYINSQETNLIYPSKYWLWGVLPFILYWNCRLWMKTNRKEIPDDPVLFAVYDWQTLVILSAVLNLFFLAARDSYLQF